MKKIKILFLTGMIIISIFLFIHPIRAENEILGINPTDDREIQGLWDKDGFFIEGLNYSSWNFTVLRVGWDGITAEQLPREHRIYLKFNISTKPNKTIISMILRLRVIGDFGDEGRNYNMTTNLVANNWNEYDLHWDNVPDDMNKSVEWIIYPEYYGGEDLYINLTSFIDYIENNTLSINIIMESLVNYWIKYYISFASKDAEEYKPTLIVEYSDIPSELEPDLPSSFILTSNADTPDIDGIFILYWTNSEYANNYSIYQNNILFDSGLIVLYYLMEIYSNGTYNFKVIAFNDYGNSTSNEITIIIKIPKEPEPEPISNNKDFIIGIVIGVVISSVITFGGIIGITIYLNHKKKEGGALSTKKK